MGKKFVTFIFSIFLFSYHYLFSYTSNILEKLNGSSSTKSIKIIRSLFGSKVVERKSETIYNFLKLHLQF